MTFAASIFLRITSGRRARHLLAALMLCIAAMPLHGWAANQASVTIDVPRRSGAAQLEISLLKIIVVLDSPAPVALHVDGPDGALDTQSMNLTTTANDCFAGPVCFMDFPTPPAGLPADHLTVVKPLQVGADPSGDPNKVVLWIRLLSNINEAGGCVSTWSTGTPQQWTVSVVGGAARIAGFSVQSLDKKTTGACGTTFRPIPLNDGPLTTVEGEPNLLQGGRVGTDAVLVLDRSGSMASPAATGGDPKISRLHDAAKQFIDMWQALRANESVVSGGSPAAQSPNDRLGVVYFDDQIKWLSELVPASQLNDLQTFSSLNLSNEEANINSVAPGGSTSIGGGLLKAAGVLAPAPGGEPSRKVILLMSDGMQNTPSWAWANDTQVFAGPTSGTCPPPPAPPTPSCPPLPNQPPIQIYGVTVGVGTFADPVINQAVTHASKGFPLNTETDAEVLPTLFIQVLQNVIKYSTIETLRVIADSTSTATPFQTQVPVTTTADSLAFSLNWSARQGALRVVFTTPGGRAIAFDPPRAATGLLTGNIPFGVNVQLTAGSAPGTGLGDTAGIWTVQVIPIGENTQTIPFKFTLLGDDTGLSSSLQVAHADYAVGGKIRLTARINGIEGPVTGLSGQPNGRVQVAAVRPGANLADVLSDSAVQPGPQQPTDPRSTAQRKLEALLASNPNAVAHASDTITLTDNGGGLFTGEANADFEGHYTFVFTVQGDAPGSGQFVRQQIGYAYVRSLPDPQKTDLNAVVGTTTTGGTAQVVNVTFTPHTALGGRVGPGWANYFWFDVPGGKPVKPVDNLDGRYTAQIGFTGAVPAGISLHFLPQPVPRPDEFVPTSNDLTAGNTLVPTLNVGSSKTGLPWWVWLLVAVLVLALLLLLLRRLVFK